MLASLPWGRLGMTICYDLRFPGLYRDLAQAGAAFLTAPSAFTRVTGQAHWHTLLLCSWGHGARRALAPGGFRHYLPDAICYRHGSM